MKQLSLRFKLYALVVSLLLIMGISIVVTAQLSLGAMEKRLSVETRDTVQGIVMDQLSATAGQGSVCNCLSDPGSRPQCYYPQYSVRQFRSNQQDGPAGDCWRRA